MRSSLQASNIPEALKALHPSLHPRFQTLWDALGGSLPTVAGSLGEIADGMLATGYAELSVARPVEGQPGQLTAFGIRFDQGADGVWRIGEM